MKIALVSHTPLYKRSNGYELLLTSIVRVFLNQKHDVKVFSLGKENKLIKQGMYEEHIIKSPKMEESGFGLRRLYEFLILGWFGYRPSIEKINKCKKILSKLDEFNPDLIFVGEFTLIDLLTQYKKLHKRVRMITHSDSFSVIENSFGLIKPVDKTCKALECLKYYAKIFIMKNYFNYHMRQFEKMLKLCDVIIVPSVRDKRKIDIKFSSYAKKVKVIPLVLINRRESKIGKGAPIVKKIKKVLFLGAYNYWPNREAMGIIENYVAPKLPGIEFLIQGKACPKMKKGNVNYVGELALDQLDNLISECDAFIAPMIQHTSIKTKILEYFLSGKPIVGTSEAFYGYPIKNRTNVMVERDPKKLYLSFIELNNNPKLIAKLQKNMKDVVSSMLPEKIESRFIKIIKI